MFLVVVFVHLCVCVLAGSQLITCPYNGKIVQAQDGVFLVKAAERQTVLCAPPVVQSWNCFHWGLPSSCFGLGIFPVSNTHPMTNGRSLLV